VVLIAGAMEVTVYRIVTDTVQFVRNVSTSQRKVLFYFRVATSAELSINSYYIVWLHKSEISSLTVLLISIIHHPVIYVHVYRIQCSGKTFLQPICIQLSVPQLLHASLILTFFIIVTIFYLQKKL
jgi:hypothetical protein